ncbi:MAG TPA: sulfatase-like hydrolase/transferase, partial [Anaerohalosphaeraceae bacterium]|nr:sulfatase-like hydrolase/transferase [Anaerohalosphaeraceae bacterium]
MNRRNFLKSTGLGFVALSGLRVCDLLSIGEKNRPNILFIFVDDMGYADPSCYGNTKIQTPNIDRLARQGIQFTQFYANSPVCSPSRVA